MNARKHGCRSRGGKALRHALKLNKSFLEQMLLYTKQECAESCYTFMTNKLIKHAEKSKLHPPGVHFRTNRLIETSRAAMYEILTPRLRLSVITASDAAAVFATMNDLHTAHTISFMTWPMTMEQAENWCRKSEEGKKDNTDLLYIARKDNVPVGCIGLHREGDRTETGYWVHAGHQGYGYATEMLGAVTNLAFNGLMRSSLWATAIPDNIRSQRVLQKHGFVKTGEIIKPVASANKVAERYVFELKHPRHV